jgi:hypothetical protein
MNTVNISSYIVSLLIGIIIGALIYDLFLSPDFETKVEFKETIKSDTVYLTVKDTVYLDRTKIVHKVLRDTILADGYKPQIKAFNAVFPLLYGNAFLQGEVLGEVLKTSLTTDFKIPSVINIITKEKNTTIIKKPTGFYAVGGISSNFSYSLGLSFLRDKSMFGYRYQPNLQIHSLEVGFKVF